MCGMRSPPDFSQGTAYISSGGAGRYLPIAEAAIPITDWGFLRSDATYDVVTVWDGAFFRLDLHLERFFRSCARFRLDPGISAPQVVDILTRCVQLSGLRAAYVEMICTRGQPPWGSRDPRQAVNRFHAFAVPFVWIANEEQRRRGLHVKLSGVQRIAPQSVDPTAKNYHWNDLTMGLLQALDEGHDTVLLGDAAGHIVEGPGFNVFALKGPRLVTPAEGVLHGITRRTAIEIAGAAGFAVHETPLARQTLLQADEVFLTSSGGGILPVTRLDGRPVGSGSVGPVTRRFSDTYWAWHRLPLYTTPIDYDPIPASDTP
jgi:branched-chain amino acid aminotransferase